MKKLISILIALFFFATSFAQVKDYSLGLDTIKQQTLNVKVSNNPNISVMDKDFITSMNDFKFQQVLLLNEINNIKSELKQVQNRNILSLSETVVKNKGLTDEQIQQSIKRNYFIKFYIYVVFILWFLFQTNKLLKNETFNDQKTPLLRLSLYLMSTFIFTLMGYITYYCITALLNPNYLILQDLIRLFG